MGPATQDLPSGIVTFVFTDIEGSTRLLNHLGDRYAEMLARHDALLREVWTQYRGVEVSTEGDQFFVAFESTEDAVLGCIAAQLAVAGAEWPDGVRVRDRAGIHRGLASPQDGDYVALAVHQAKRVIDTAHGGQVILSQEAADGLGPNSGIGLKPLGRYRVRDFSDPVRLYQVLADGLDEAFPAVRALPADGHNIVRPDTTIIGRTDDVAAITHQIHVGETTTLVGPGGVGKSRLAAEVGIAIAPAWEDGVWFVDLSALDAPDLVAGAVASAIGARSDPAGVRSDDVLRHLETRRTVLILDNCEQVADACRELIGAIHDRCPGTAVLATSREPLRARGERLWPVLPLALPPEAGAGADAVLASPAGRLFWERGRAVVPGFSITKSNAAAVADICRHLDGLPLLIELAAAHLPHQSPEEIRDGLEQGLRLLTSRDPRLTTRHRTVEALLGWSYRLLDPPDQVTLRRLSVFGGSFSRDDAVAAVADPELGTEDVPELLWSLVDRSLVTAHVAAGGSRYRLFDTVRGFARGLLEYNDELEETVRHLAGWYLERIGPWRAHDQSWMSEVGIELDNLRGLIAIMPPEDVETAQQIACTIGQFHDAVQTFRDGAAELTRITERLDQASPTRVSLLTTLAYLCARTGQLDRAAATIDEAEAVRRGHGAPEWDEVGIERVRGEIARRRGDLAGAVEIARNALGRALGDHGEARMQNLLGISAAALGDFETAYAACQRELELNQALGRTCSSPAPTATSPRWRSGWVTSRQRHDINGRVLIWHSPRERRRWWRSRSWWRHASPPMRSTGTPPRHFTPGPSRCSRRSDSCSTRMINSRARP